LLQFLIGLGMIGNSFLSFGISSWLKTTEGEVSLSGLFLVFGIGYFVLGVSALLLSRGYVKGYERSRRRGRHVAAWGIVLVFLGLLFLPEWEKNQGPLGTVLFNLIMIYYLGRPKVKAYFGTRSRG
jgi:hypothetical protein